MWKTDQHTAVKHFPWERVFETELSCYKRLAEHGIRRICGLAVPRLCAWDDDLLVIEMELVSPPCLIDFGKAYLDNDPATPDHSEETLRYHNEEQEELWEDYYTDVQTILWKLMQDWNRLPRPKTRQYHVWRLGLRSLIMIV